MALVYILHGLSVTEMKPLLVTTQFMNEEIELTPDIEENLCPNFCYGRDVRELDLTKFHG